MCTTIARNEIIADVVAHRCQLPRRYAEWLIGRLDDRQILFVLQAAVAGRRSLVREIAATVRAPRRPPPRRRPRRRPLLDA